MELNRKTAIIAPDHFKRLSQLLERERLVEHAAIRAANSQSLADRERQGTALGELRLQDQSYGIGEQVLLSFGRENAQRLPRLSFEVGDVLRLSPVRAAGGSSIDVSVAELEQAAITVAIHGRIPDWVEAGGRIS